MCAQNIVFLEKKLTALPLNKIFWNIYNTNATIVNIPTKLKSIINPTNSWYIEVTSTLASFKIISFCF